MRKKTGARVESGSALADDGAVPFLLDGDGRALDVRSVLGKLEQLLLDVVDVLRLFDGGRGRGGRGRVVHQEDGRLLGGLGREEEEYVVVLVELVDPVTQNESQ